MIRRSIFILFGLLVLMMIPVQAQALPNSAWYAVVYQPETDSLHWINASGQQATMPRPTLQDEAQYLDMRISPDGRTMIMHSQLNSGLEAIGVYDFATSIFVQTHQAQPGETVHLGGENIFTTNSQYFAVGLFSGDFASPAWRVILFESQTGNVVAFVDHTHPDAPEVQLSAPAVQYIDGAYVHFQLIPQSVGGWHTWPAYAWRAFGFDPAEPAIVESPYTRANVQIQLLTGQVAMSYTDDNYAVAPPDGPLPNFNAIGSGILANEAPMTTIHADGTRYHLATRWAKGGEWILFLSDDALGNRYWNNVLANGVPGNNSHMPFDPQFVDVYGTTDGYLLVNDLHALYYTNGFMPNTALNIAQLTANSQIIYVTPIGVNFMLASLDGQPDIIAPPPAQATETPVPEVPIDCSLAPAQRVAIGTEARVLPSMGGLNVRQEPNGAIVITLGGGEAFAIIGGPICNGGLYWWQIERAGTVGWLAEGTSSGYFIEPYEGAPPPPPPPPVVEEEGVPPVVCDGALPTRLAVGSGATILTNNLRPHNGPNGEILARKFMQSGTAVNVTAGPECVNGQNWWLVSGQAKVGRIGNKFEAVQGWVPESSSNAYNVAP